ncbi:hypothetical protein FQR65_LT05232 [Abscondita terminalis]|nr:hypothetical protein FQR65_LT05232 [Abscondita terminalis]
MRLFSSLRDYKWVFPKKIHTNIERSVSFANLISSLDTELLLEASKKNSIELLLALDDFITKEKNPSLSIQFFIEKILKNCRSLIDNYHDTSAKLLSLKETVNQLSLTEDPKQLQIKLLDLIKEKQQLSKPLPPEVILTRLEELTNDLKKFRFEHDRDFMHEIAMHEAELKAYTQELEEINEQATQIEEELTFPIEHLQTNLKIKQRALYHLEVEKYTLKKISIGDIIEKLLSQLELENTRISLIAEHEECDPIKILKKQIEHPKTKQEDLRTESKINKDLTQNAHNLNVITESFKDIIQLVSIKNNNIIKIFLERIKTTLNFNIDKNALEAKQTKANDANTTLQEELVTFLLQNESELIQHFKELAEDKQEGIEKLQIEKQNLEMLDKKNKLKSQISEVEEKIQTTKNDQRIFSIIKDNNLLQLLIYLERLQKFTDNTFHEIDKLQTQITALEKQITELEREADKKDATKLDAEWNKEKIKSRAKIKILKNKFNLALNEQLKIQKTNQQVAEDYNQKIKEDINIIRNLKTQEWHSQLTQDESVLQSNAMSIELLTVEIEKHKKNATWKREWQSAKSTLDEIETLLLKNVVETSTNDDNQENKFFVELKVQLEDLKKQVENPIWNKLGWGFFFKKIPDGIQKIRAIFNTKQFDTLEPETNVAQNNLMMLNIFSEIYPLIRQKKFSTHCLRSPTVKNFYHSFHESLTQVNNQFLALKEPKTLMQIKSTRDGAKFTLYRLAKTLNMPHSVLLRLIHLEPTKRVNNPRIDTLNKIVEFFKLDGFNITVNDLLMGLNDGSELMIQDQPTISFNTETELPLYSFNALKLDKIGKINIKLSTPTQHLIALQSEQEIKPIFKKGSIFIVDPNAALEKDSLIAVKIENNLEILIRKLHIEFDKILLMTYDNSTAPLIFNPKLHSILGVVVQVNAKT